ncbi:Holliday junction resolvase Hjc [Nanoarchaeota archaeon]
MNTKAKGSNAERELIHLFWEAGFAAMRAAGSGSTQLPSPDILVGNPIRKFGVECKATKENKQYLNKTQIEELKEFCTKFGAEPWIAVRFDKNSKNPDQGWYFLTIDNLKETEGNNFVITSESAQARGLLFEELVYSSQS